MKNIFVLLFLCTGILSSSAQITLDANNTPHSSSFTSVRGYVFNGIIPPEEGANLIYDFSYLPTAHPVNSYSIDYFPAVRSSFSNSTRFDIGASEVGSLELDTEYYSMKTSDGIFNTGNYVSNQILNLQSVTGNSQDSIVFPDQSNVYDTPSPVLSFPHTFGTSSTSHYSIDANFELTVNAYNLSNVPGRKKQNAVMEIETVGYGKLILPLEGGQSIPYDVLMLKKHRVHTDSVYLGGAPAPQALLNAFGLIQGDTIVSNNYEFYAEDFERPLLTIIMNEDWTDVDQLFYESDNLTIDESTSVNTNTLDETVKIYPNPVTNQLQVNFSDNYFSPKRITIYDIYGKEIKNVKLDAEYEKTIETQNLSNGTYFLRIDSNDETTTRKFVVKK